MCHGACVTFLLLILWLPALQPALAQNCDPSQVSALQDFFYATDGPVWAEGIWILGQDPCVGGWGGLDCSGTNPNVIVYGSACVRCVLP